MATITASDVNKLRQITGAGMMDCKKALQETDGDFEKAIDELRKKGQKVAANRSDRDAKEGVVLAKENNDKTAAALVCLNCETDFVAKNQEFIDVTQTFLNIAIDKMPANSEELKNQSFNNDITIGDKIIEMVGKIGEKIDLSAYEVVKAQTVVTYIHPGNKLATVVGLNKTGNKVVDAGKQVAMQVAAMNPVSIDKNSVSKEIIDRELEIAKEQVRQEGKPENMVDKIAEGKLNKFFKESTLLSQQFIRDNNITVEQFLKQIDPDLTVTAFKRVALG
ncbi:MAG: elongation factor Ts [Flavobacteriales bacterium]|nr:elongation factor Ts [Flavobacteriales bacterium]